MATRQQETIDKKQFSVDANLMKGVSVKLKNDKNIF